MKSPLPLPPSPSMVVNQLSRKMLGSIPQLVKRLPQPPFFIQKKIGEKVLQKLMAEQLEMGEFDFLEGHYLQLCIDDMGLTFFLTFKDEHLVLSAPPEQADVVFSGSSSEFLLLAGRLEDPDTLFFQRRLIIEGDTELGLTIKNSIDGIDFDNWPSWLNQLIHKIAQLVKEPSEAGAAYPHPYPRQSYPVT